MRVPYRKVEELFNVLFRMRFVPASAMGFDRAATRKGQALYEDLKEKLRVAVAANADETSWRQDGISHYLWYAGNEDLALYHIDRHRSSEAAKLLLGEDFAGVLTTDGYAAYNAVNAKERQTCLAHLIRSCKEIKQEILLKAVRFQDSQALAFVDEVGSLLKNACAQGGKLRAGKIRRATALQRRRGFYRQLDTICARPLMDQKALALQHRLTDADKDKPRLFTFLKHPHLQPTNNQAERSLRGMVILVGVTSAWSSARMGRVPSRDETTTEPVASFGRSARNSSEGLATSARPDSFISNTPISFVEPKRFLTARRMRKAWPRSPSKYSTVSTICSSTRGPAMAPSLVTWPMRKVGMPVRLA
jgi:hypothetical protein